VLTKPTTHKDAIQPNDPVLYRRALEIGKETLKAEGSKAAAARAIYKVLADEHREVILRAFVEGATITPKGSPTYYHAIKRKLRRQRALD